MRLLKKIALFKYITCEFLSWDDAGFLIGLGGECLYCVGEWRHLASQIGRQRGPRTSSIRIHLFNFPVEVRQVRVLWTR